ncbi:MAG: nucleotidyltransferase family protein [Candidatus Brocadiia bacterium]|jgi:glucose-1-phosphate thymidylyltransferase|nr:nucleotidyltransferase family protein [Candidatus Brocadiia bacterium]
MPEDGHLSAAITPEEGVNPVDALLLAGGYATRLYPLTLDRPKALLPVGGRTIVDRIIDLLMASDEIERFVFVTNDRFAPHFISWVGTRTWEKPVEVLNDGTTSNEGRLGAMGDIRFALDHAELDTARGLFVLSTDNLTHLNLTQLVGLSQERAATAVFALRVGDLARLRRMGVVQLDEAGRVIDFVEKPKEPKSDLGVPSFYAYSARAVGLVKDYLDAGGNPDAPGHFIEWLAHRDPVYACVTEEAICDVGTLEAYEAMCRQYGGDEHRPT